MNLNNLKTSYIYNNYKELCHDINVIPKAGNSKKKHMNEIEKYYELEKIGNKIKVIKKREIPLLTPSKKSPYRKTMQLLIIELLANEEEKSMSITQDRLFYALAMVNNDFKKYRNEFKMQRLANEIEVGKDFIQDFYARNTSNFKSIVEGALDSLQKDFILHWKREINFAYENYGHKTTSPEEKEMILACQREAMTILEAKSTQELYLKGDYAYMKELATNIYNEKFANGNDIKFFYHTYDISFNYDFKYIKEKEIQIIEDLKKEMNHLVIDNLIQNAKNRINEEDILTKFALLVDKIIKN